MPSTAPQPQIQVPAVPPVPQARRFDNDADFCDRVPDQNHRNLDRQSH